MTLCSPSALGKELGTTAQAAKVQGLAEGSLLQLGVASRPKLIAGTGQQKWTGPKGQSSNCPSQDLRRCQLLLTVPCANCQNKQFNPSTQNVPDAPGTHNQLDPCRSAWKGKEISEAQQALLSTCSALQCCFLPSCQDLSHKLRCRSRSVVLWKTPPDLLAPSWLNQDFRR